MPTATAFRLSFFSCLALACACLALADAFFLWWIGYLLAATYAVLVLAYRSRERWLLGADAANRLGMVIAIGSAFWILYNLPHYDEDLMAVSVPWPAGLLPHLGPVLVLLLLVKLFRPKRLGDFWMLQTIGLMMVMLGCVLATDTVFGVLLVAYLAALLWCLALFYLVHSQARCAASGASRLADTPLFCLSAAPPVAGADCVVPWRHWGLGRAARWTAVVVLLGAVLFLLAPRRDNYQWEPKQLTRAAKGILKTGFDSGMDCSRVGKIELSEDPAFEVQAMDARGPKLDLDPETRWYMQTLDYYSQGHWTSWDKAPQHLTWGISNKPDPMALPSVEGRSHPRFPPAHLADGEFYLYFRVRLDAAGSLVLAEPLTGTRLGLYPHLGENPVEGSFFFHLVGSDSLLANTTNKRRLFQYGQVSRKLDDPNRVPAKDIKARYKQFLLSQDIHEAIFTWVRELLNKLPELANSDRQLDALGRVPSAAHAKVAQALAQHLAYSGDFGYSLDLRRHQPNMDPLADFLLNVKEGHCERYAGSLTLMLRSLGIPARVVKGYRGINPLEPGQYLIRQSQAHSWVEALIEDEKGEVWLTLDPTPTAERTGRPLASWFGWFLERWSEGDNLWRAYVMEYNADGQASTFALLRDYLTPDNPASAMAAVAVTAGLFGVGYAAFRYRRRRARSAALDPAAGILALPSQGAGFYLRYLDVVHRFLDLRPEQGQTPREFGLMTQLRLEKGELGDCAAIPLTLVNLLYGIRYGGRALTPEEEQRANDDVRSLESRIGMMNREPRIV